MHNFLSIISVLNPVAVTTLLDQVYFVLDAAVGIFDVYKIETIGDSYMVTLLGSHVK